VHDYWPEHAFLGSIRRKECWKSHASSHTEAHFFNGDSGEVLPLEDASVDLALSTISFHHWQDQAAGVREVARVLRPGGSFLAR